MGRGDIMGTETLLDGDYCHPDIFWDMIRRKGVVYVRHSPYEKYYRYSDRFQPRPEIIATDTLT